MMRIQFEIERNMIRLESISRERILKPTWFQYCSPFRCNVTQSFGFIDKLSNQSNHVLRMPAGGSFETQLAIPLKSYNHVFTINALIGALSANGDDSPALSLSSEERLRG
jgi:hypothetical protein